jgi:putative copper export protein
VPDAGPAWTGALAAPLALAALAVSWSGHAAAGTDAALGIALDVVHSWATALWLGGLLGLLVLAAPLVRALGGTDRVRLAAGVVVRFSALAVAAVAVLVVTGTYRALAELSSLSDLWSTPYGLALLVKLALFAVMLAVAAVNRFVLHPRLERGALGLAPDDRGAASGLWRSVRVEVGLAAAVMVAVAVLVTLAPPG